MNTPPRRKAPKVLRASAGPLALAALSCLAGWDMPTTFAAKPLPKKTKTSRSEVYNAVDDVGSIPDAAPGSAPLGEVAASYPSATQPSRKDAPKPSPAGSQGQAQAKTFTAPPYESVPDDQRELIARRLTLVSQLILEHGRAYDYRALTLAQLEALVGHLGTQTPPAAPIPAPRLEEATPSKEARAADEPLADSVAIEESEDS
jgi:hypothetical protein